MQRGAATCVSAPTPPARRSRARARRTLSAVTTRALRRLASRGNHVASEPRVASRLVSATFLARSRNATSRTPTFACAAPHYRTMTSLCASNTFPPNPTAAHARSARPLQTAAHVPGNRRVPAPRRSPIARPVFQWGRKRRARMATASASTARGVWPETESQPCPPETARPIRTQASLGKVFCISLPW